MINAAHGGRRYCNMNVANEGRRYVIINVANEGRRYCIYYVDGTSQEDYRNISSLLCRRS